MQNFCKAFFSILHVTTMAITTDCVGADVRGETAEAATSGTAPSQCRTTD